MNRERELWWLNPAKISAVMGVIVALGAYLVPESTYRTFWYTPKFFDTQQLWITLACIAAFSSGAWASSSSRLHPRPIESNSDWMENIPWKFVTRVFNGCFYLSLLAYIAWAGAAISRGANLQLASGVLHGDKGASYVMKEVYLGTISGVTTLTQLAMTAIVLGVMIGLARGWRGVWPKFVILFALTLVRALMNSERLALMELFIPGIVLFVRLGLMDSGRIRARIWAMLRMAPAIGYSGLLVVFGASEYFRSWINFYAGGDLSFWTFVSARLLGYYVTALNNGALLIQRIEPTGAPFFTLHFLWRFPLVSNLMDVIYPNFALASIENDPYMAYLKVEANPEFNNGGGLLEPIMDFGFVGALLYWLLAGLLAGLLYRWFQEKRMAGLLLYPATFIGVIELPRIIYWAEGRVIIPQLALCGVAMVCAYYTRQFRTTEESLAWQPSR
jgi:oligosaccharide repeat unit polymerase